MTPPRQIWLFQLGCWMTFATAVVHLLGHLLVASPSTAVAEAIQYLPGYLFLVPGQDVPSSREVTSGLSLSLSLLLATIAGAGLAVGKRGHDDPLLLRGVARAYALGLVVLLVVSILMFFSVQSFFIATTALCFGLAAVSEN